MDAEEKATSSAEEPPRPEADDAPAEGATQPSEHGGPKGLEPTRYGDWERNGRCYDF